MNFVTYKEGRAIKALGRREILLAASSILIFGSFIGCAIYRFLGIGESELYDKLIERYFIALFYDCGGAADILRVIFDVCFHELTLFFIVFIAGYSPFSLIIGIGALLYRGLLFGFSITMLQLSAKSGLLLCSIIYLSANFAISILLAVLTADAFELAYIDEAPRLKSKKSLNYFLKFLRICALTVIYLLIMLFLIYIYI